MIKIYKIKIKRYRRLTENEKKTWAKGYNKKTGVEDIKEKWKNKIGRIK